MFLKALQNITIVVAKMPWKFVPFGIACVADIYFSAPKFESEYQSLYGKEIDGHQQHNFNDGDYGAKVLGDNFQVSVEE